MDTNTTLSPEDVKVIIITNIAVNADQINPQISTSATAMFCGAFDTCGAGKGGGGGERVRGLSENSERREGRRKRHFLPRSLPRNYQNNTLRSTKWSSNIVNTYISSATYAGCGWARRTTLFLLYGDGSLVKKTLLTYTIKFIKTAALNFQWYKNY